MKIMTLRLKPKTIFGIILALTGIIVIVVSFAANHTDEAQKTSAAINVSTDEKRREYLANYGWELDDEAKEKTLKIPSVWNSVYKDYNEIQTNQGFDLSKYKGKSVTLYTYTVTNYDNEECVVADMLVYNGELIGGDICSTSADDGFMTGFDGKN